MKMYVIRGIENRTELDKLISFLKEDATFQIYPSRYVVKGGELYNAPYGKEPLDLDNFFKLNRNGKFEITIKQFKSAPSDGDIINGINETHDLLHTMTEMSKKGKDPLGS
jgi:hypothetical protein